MRASIPQISRRRGQRMTHCAERMRTRRSRDAGAGAARAKAGEHSIEDGGAFRGRIGRQGAAGQHGDTMGQSRPTCDYRRPGARPRRPCPRTRADIAATFSEIADLLEQANPFRV